MYVGRSRVKSPNSARAKVYCTGRAVLSALELLGLCRYGGSILASSAPLWKCDTSAVHVAAEHRLLRSCSGV